MKVFGKSFESAGEALADRFATEMNEVLRNCPEIDPIYPRDFVGQFEELIKIYGFEQVQRATTAKLAKEIVAELDWEGLHRLPEGDPPLKAWYSEKLTPREDGK